MACLRFCGFSQRAETKNARGHVFDHRITREINHVFLLQTVQQGTRYSHTSCFATIRRFRRLGRYKDVNGSVREYRTAGPRDSRQARIVAFCRGTKKGLPTVNSVLHQRADRHLRQGDRKFARHEMRCDTRAVVLVIEVICTRPTFFHQHLLMISSKMFCSFSSKNRSRSCSRV